MLNKLFALLTIALLIFAVHVYQQPDDFRITRSATIAAPASSIFANIYDLRKWQEWSPWAKIDPDAKTIFEGASEGKGAIMRWDSAMSKVGKGSMTLMDSRPDEYIQFVLEFEKPMAATDTAEFTLTPDGDKTTVTWTMSGKNNYLGKLFSFIFDCEKMVGGQFEEGLENLRAIVEPPPAQ